MRLNSKKPAFSCLLMGLLTAVVGTACSSSNNAVKRLGGGGKGADATAQQNDATNDTKSTTNVDSFQKVSGGSFMVKNYLQLHAAIDACVGPKLVTITDDMFADQRCPNAPAISRAGDKRTILGVDKCVARGKNILDLLQSQLWAPTQAARTDTLSNAVTPDYLTALGTVADVYAHGVADPGSLCSTMDQTRVFLGRCLSQYDEKTLEGAATAVNQLCAKGGAFARAAIATVLGSAAFAAAAPNDDGAAASSPTTSSQGKGS